MTEVVKSAVQRANFVAATNAVQLFARFAKKLDHSGLLCLVGMPGDVYDLTFSSAQERRFHT